MNYKIVIIGAGSTNFGLGIVSDFFKSKILRGATIVLHDIKSNIVKGVPKYWNELKKNSKKYKIKEIFKKGSKMECGLGILIKND